MFIGSWNIDVNVNGMPQKIATAFEKVNEAMSGAEYEMIAYLGSQLANGFNHAVLAEQILTTGRDVRNIVVMIFHEKTEADEAVLTAIERVLDGNTRLGGTDIRVEKNLAEDSDEMKVWNEAFEGYVGFSVHPFAYLGSQTTSGINLIYAATMELLALEGQKHVATVAINPLEHKVTFMDFLTDRQSTALGYAFNW